MKTQVRSFALAIVMVGFLPLPVISQTSSPKEGEMNGVWKTTCTDGACRAFLSLQSGQETAVTWSIVKDPVKGQISSLIQTPPGVALPPGVRIYITDTEFFDVPFQVCEASGCTAILVMDDKMQKAVAGQKTVRVAFVRYGQPQTFAYEIPVDGFAAAVAAL